MISDRDPFVSIICLAYNHKKYIEKAIDSILAQKTTFDIEILISDDASTDGTTEIIKRYVAQHPKIIKPIIYENNQYSQGLDVITPLIAKAKGEYIAFCECDDYFTCEYKIEKQVQYLESHSNSVAYIHDAVKVNESGNRKMGIRSPLIQKEYLDISDIIQCIASNYALNTLMVRAKCIKSLPDFYYTSPVKDIPLAVSIALHGKFYYDKEILAAYRIRSVGSWSEQTGKSLNEINKYCTGMIQILHEIDDFTEGKYHNLLEEKFELYKFWYIVNSNPKQIFVLRQHREYFKKLSFESKCKIISKICLPKYMRRKY